MKGEKEKLNGNLIVELKEAETQDLLKGPGNREVAEKVDKEGPIEYIV